MEVLGAGSVVQRDKSKPRGKCRDWELSVQVLVDGVKRRRTRAYHGAWRGAQAALAEFAAELADTAPPSGYTFERYARRWHARRVESGEFALKTMRNEAIRIDALCREFPDMALEDLTADVLRSRYPAWRARWSQATMDVMHETLSTMLRAALADGLVATNAAKEAGRPKGGRASSRRALPESEMRRLSHALDPSDGRQLAVLLCLTCGLRKGEVVALRWSDWDGESVHVERADDGTGHDKPPKTPAGVRSVPAPSWLAPVLDGLRGDPPEPLCMDAWGRRIGGGALSTWWHGFRASVGTDATLHELRHSYLTQLARAGVHPRVMMRLAGHESMKVCMEIYTHVSDDMQRDAVARAFG